MQTFPGRNNALPWLAASGVYLGLTALYAWPVVASLGSRLPSDIGDPGLNTWILWWNARAVPLTEHWWDAPIFFPLRGAFALSETLLGVTPLTSPLQWLGATPVVAYDVAFLLSYVTAAIAAHALAYRLTGRHGLALIAGLAYGFNPYRAAQLPHLQMLVSCWMPLALLGLHAYLSPERDISSRRRCLLLAGAAWLLNGLTSGYYLVYFAVLTALWLIWFVRTRREALTIAAVLTLASLPLVPLAAGYAHDQQMLGASRGFGEIVFFSADLSAIWAASPLLWLSRHWTIVPRPEGELYPGATVLALWLTGAVAGWRARPAAAPWSQSPLRRGVRRVLLTSGLLVSAIGVLSLFGFGGTTSFGGVTISITRPFKTFTSAAWLLTFAALLHPRLAAARRRHTPAFFYGLAAVVMFALALGPMPHAFGEPIIYRGPYAGLMALPGGYSLRVPARFAMLMMLCLSQAAALALARLSAGRPRPAIVAAVSLFIVLDGWMGVMKTDAVPAAIDLSAFDRSHPVLELPMGDTYDDAPAMLRATSHGHPLVNGFSGYVPADYEALKGAIDARRPDALDGLRQLGALIVIVNPAKDEDRQLRTYVARMPGAQLVRESNVGIVYLLPRR